MNLYRLVKLKVGQYFCHSVTVLYNCCLNFDGTFYLLFPGKPESGKTKLYKPTSKLAELAATFKSNKDEDKEERERERERERDQFRPVSYL